MSTFILDLCPVELVHMIFEYLWAQEIFQSFFNISDYFNSILLNYDNCLVNFQSVLKKNFDLICAHIQPDQVISLTLSDSDDTPGQSQLFLSFFSINQFTRLRALTLNEIDHKSQSLFLNLDELKNLISLELELKFFLSIQKMPPQIKKLTLNDTAGIYHHTRAFIFTSRLDNLHHLTLQHCSCGQLSDIFYFFPNLRTLNTSITAARFRNDYNFAIHYPNSSPFGLTHLMLTINLHVSRVDLERFLGHLPQLRELELVCTDGHRNLASANQWESFIIDRLPLLSTFNFMFHLLSTGLDADVILAPFRSPFWINETRHWFVAYNHQECRLFTVPRFAPHIIAHPYVPVLSNLTTVPIEQHAMFSDHITELTWSSNNEILYQFGQVKMLTLLNFDINEKMVNLKQVQYLSVSISERWSFHQLLHMIKQSMPRVHCLKLHSAFDIESAEPTIRLVQIRTLYLSYFASLAGKNVIDLSPFFPYVERLTATIRTRRQLTFLIDRFVHLSSGSFYVLNCQIGVKKNLREPPVTREWLLNNTRRLSRKAQNSITCRFDYQTLFWLHLWISDNNGYQKQKKQWRKR